jgi:hypothetical protein
MKPLKRCIGFGPYEGSCDNVAGTKCTPLWCERCDQLRMDHLNKQMNKLRQLIDAEDSEAQ